MEQDQQLMSKVKNGDQMAFRQLYEKYRNPIYSYVYTMIHHKHQADDLTQEVFLKVFRNRNLYDEKQKFTTWLWTIAKNTTIDFVRAKKEVLLDENSDGELSFDHLESLEPDAENILINKANEERLNCCMEELTIEMKQILTLRVVSELSYDEIADQVNLTLANVKTLIFRAKERLINCLSENNSCTGNKGG